MIPNFILGSTVGMYSNKDWINAKGVSQVYSPTKEMLVYSYLIVFCIKNLPQMEDDFVTLAKSV